MQSVELEVLIANGRFYEHFARGDLDGMLDSWARDAPVAVCHPGWPPLRGAERVFESWSRVCENPPPVACEDPTAHILGDSAYVVCTEVIGDVRLTATNVFVRERGAWRLVHHQASR